MSSRLVLVSFYVAGAVLVTYAGLELMRAVNEVLAHIPVVR
jgi:hypothetical protein